MLFENGHAQIAIHEDQEISAEHITDMPVCWTEAAKLKIVQESRRSEASLRDLKKKNLSSGVRAPQTAA
jgi:hypothetical protein